MTTQVKLLNDTLAATAKLLDTVWSNDDPILWMSDNGEEIEMTLREASEALAMVAADNKSDSMWVYGDGKPLCDGDSCTR